MSFLSEVFLVFLAVVWIAYFLTPLRWRWIVLLAASYAFYCYNGVRPAVYILFVTVTTFLFAIRLENMQTRAKRRQDELRALGDKQEEIKALRKRTQRNRRWVVFAMLLLDFGLLCFFKFGNVGVSLLNRVLEPDLSFMTLALPLGLSFFTFQSVGYVLDVYKNRQRADRNIFQYALFVSFFPQLIQGPISRYNQLAGQLTAPNKFDFREFTYGLQLMLWGYLKKVIIADRLIVAVNAVFGNFRDYSGPMYVFGVLLFGLQLYADFSGGIDITIGIAQTFGIRITPNFLRPYFSRTLAEFWRRWHITLGAWMREYVLFPIALSRPIANLTKKLRSSVGVFLSKTIPICISTYVVFIIVGLWHGSSLNFLLFGLCQGTIITVGALCQPLFRRAKGLLRIDDESGGWRVVQMLFTLGLISFSRLFISVSTLPGALHIVGEALGSLVKPLTFILTIADGIPTLGINDANWAVAFIATLILFVVGVEQERGVHIREWIGKQHLLIRWTIYIGAILCVVIFGVYGIGYSAVSFRYGGY